MEIDFKITSLIKSISGEKFKENFFSLQGDIISVSGLQIGYQKVWRSGANQSEKIRFQTGGSKRSDRQPGGSKRSDRQQGRTDPR